MYQFSSQIHPILYRLFQELSNSRSIRDWKPGVNSESPKWRRRPSIGDQDGSSMRAFAPCGLKRTCTSYGHNSATLTLCSLSLALFPFFFSRAQVHKHVGLVCRSRFLAPSSFLVLLVTSGTRSSMKKGNSTLSSFAEKDSCSIHLIGTLVPQEQLFHIFCKFFTPIMF
jgi:hypothetical protein